MGQGMRLRKRKVGTGSWTNGSEWRLRPWVLGVELMEIYY